MILIILYTSPEIIPVNCNLELKYLNKQTNTVTQLAPLCLQIFVCKYYKLYSLFIFWKLSAEI